MFGKTVVIEGKWYGSAGGRTYIARYDGYDVRLCVSSDTVQRLENLGCNEAAIAAAVEKAAPPEIHRIEHEGRNPGENMIWLEIDNPAPRLPFELTSQGGIMTLQTLGHGLWEILIPWEVATEGWERDTGRSTSDRGELRDWMDNRSVHFADMVASRVTGIRASTVDDPRVLARRLD